MKLRNSENWYNAVMKMHKRPSIQSQPPSNGSLNNDRKWQHRILLQAKNSSSKWQRHHSPSQYKHNTDSAPHTPSLDTQRSNSFRAQSADIHLGQSMQRVQDTIVSLCQETSHSPKVHPPSLLNLCLASTSLRISSSVKRSEPAQLALLVLDLKR